MGTSALFSALNSLPLDQDEDGGDASEDDDFEGYSSEDSAAQARTAKQRPTRPDGKFYLISSPTELILSETHGFFARHDPTDVHTG